MSNALESASLIMYPSGYSNGVLGSLKPTDGSGDFTFTRGSNLSATKVGPNGYIEKGYENLLLQSNTFSDATWASVRVSESTGFAGYDGTNNAWKIVPNTQLNDHRLDQSTSVSGVWTFSIYAKAAGYDFLYILFSGIGNSGKVIDISPNQGVVVDNKGGVQAIDESITDAGNDWWKITLTYSGTLGTLRIITLPANDTSTYAGDGTSGILIQDAMLNQGLVAYPYIETTTAPVAGGILEDEPRIDFSDGCGHLLLEPSRTNAVTHSEYLNAIVSKSDSLEMNTADTQSPEGVYNASKFSFASGIRYIGPPVGGVNDIVFSVFAKSGTHNFVQFVTSSNNLFAVNFDLSDGSSNVVGTAPSELRYDAEDYGNGWYRIWFYYDNAATGATIYCWIVNSITASRASSVSTSGDIYLYGFQAEQDATYPTSYIPTYGVSQTRLVDICEASDVASLIGQTEGTMFFDFVRGYIAPSNTDIFGIIGSFNRILILFGNNATAPNITIFDSNGFRNVNFGIGFVTGERYKIAIKYTSTEVKAYQNGTLISTHDFFGFGESVTNLTLNGFNTAQQGQRYNQAILFPTALSDSECIALTTIT